ncbi:ABC transporter permease [Paenibacillus eucommiae]|uniref:Aldouronate transport system permease protein n=1 Tax=Paenibacillus eucommiae TaxID=1355755 RepID=A0ABS4IRC7_9BACL|nr:ABC transporter permease subunit [Paenibacillus eucommiae]MBP1990122.1 putative aldouronate transport system permease protein [Paenibacillus eucommiae]
MMKNQTMAIPPYSTKTKKGFVYNLLKYKVFYLMSLPALLYFFVFHYIPFVGILLAFKEYKPVQGIAGIFFGNWVGFAHFQKFFESYYFTRVFFNTLIISGYKLLFGFPAPIILALLLNEIRSSVFKRIAQTVSYLPHFLSWVVVSSLMFIILSPSTGLLEWFFNLLHIEPVYVLGSSTYFRTILVISEIWKTVGYSSIIFLAAIAGVDEEMYEAATIDGANRFQKIMYITIPSIKDMIIIVFILNIAGILNAGFEQIYLLYSPVVYDVSDVIDTYVFREGLVRLNYGFGTAIGLTKSVIALLLIIATNKIARRFGSGSLW